jgi:integrase
MVGGQSAERERVLSEVELKHIWREADACGEFGVILKALMLTGQRRSEIGRLHSSWIRNNTFYFPKTKNKKLHLLPIGPVVASLLPKVKDGLLFPARGRTDRSFCGWSKSKTVLDKRLSDAVEPWTLHDLRRTASTMWAEIGIPQHINDRLLNHISGGKQNRVSRIYNRYEYLAEKRVAIERWEQRVLEIVALEEIIATDIQWAA